MTEPAQHDIMSPPPPPGATAPQVNGKKATVIDLREAPATRVRVARDHNPFDALSPHERMKVIIRVLCELVAYGEVREQPGDVVHDEIAPDVQSG